MGDAGSTAISGANSSGIRSQSSPMEEIYIPPQLKFLIANIKNIIQTQLSPQTHQLWKAQVLKLFTANGFLGFLTGENICPDKMIEEADGNFTPNPAYANWLVADQNLASALYATISPSILPYVLNLNTCAEIWGTIDKRLQSTNRARMQQLKGELHHLSLANRTMAEYLTEIKTKTDLLAVSGSPISSEDVIYYTLNGLPASYQSFKTSIRTNLQPLSLDDLYALLCTEETLQQAELAKTEKDHTSAFFTQAVPGANRGRSGRRGGRGRGRSIQGRGRNGFIVCQICDKPGHSAAACWHRGNFQYSQDARNRNSTVQTNIANSQPEWILDTGATSHLANTSFVLSSSTPYQGSNQIVVGNGQSVPILHEGQGILPTPSRFEDASNTPIGQEY